MAQELVSEWDPEHENDEEDVHVENVLSVVEVLIFELHGLTLIGCWCR